MKSIHTWFAEYGVSHQNSFNKSMHWICVPLIFFSLVGLLASIPLGTLPSHFPDYLQPHIHLGSALILFGMLFYLRLSVPLAIGLLFYSILCLWGVWFIASTTGMLWQVSLTIFVLAWIGQFIGHKVEGAKPSFLQDLQFLMIGPAWLLGFVYKKLGISY